jgi:hypothetical protein
MATEPRAAVDLYWLPLGAGGHFVRMNGRIYEALAAWRGKRSRRDLYHSALIVTMPAGTFVIEQAWPIPSGDKKQPRSKQSKHSERTGTPIFRSASG